MSELVQIPLQGGIDRSVAKAVGAPRIDWLSCARFIQPGEIIRAPGYKYDATFTSDLQASGTGTICRAIGYSPYCGQWALAGRLAPTIWCAPSVEMVVKVPSPAKWVPAPYVQPGEDWISPAEAPRRLIVGKIADNAITRVPQVVPTDDPTLYLMFTPERRVYRIRNGVLSNHQYETLGGTWWFAAGRAYISDIGEMYTYSAATDAFTLVTTIASSTIVKVWASARFGQAGVSSQYAVAMRYDYLCHVYKWDGATISSIGDLSGTTLPTGAQAALQDFCFVYDVNGLVVALVRGVSTVPESAVSHIFNIFTLDALVQSTDFAPTLTTTPGHVMDETLSKWQECFTSMIQDEQGFIWFCGSAYSIQGYPVLIYATFRANVALNTLGNWLEIASLPNRVQYAPISLSARGSYGVCSITVHLSGGYNQVLEVWQVPKIDNHAGLVTTLAHGEIRIPITGLVVAQRAGNAIVSYRRCPFSGATQEDLVIPLLSYPNDLTAMFETASINWGNSFTLHGYASSLVPLTPACSAPSGTYADAVDGYQVAGDYLSAGLPFAIQSRPGFGGFWFDPMAPLCEFAHGSGGNLSDGTYSIIVVMVYRDYLGNIVRSAPSLPTAVVITGSTGSNSWIYVTMPQTIPGATGLSLRTFNYEIYRTVNGGSIYYLDSTFIAPYGTTTYSDAQLVSRRRLYTQGSVGALSGQVPNYSIPPCRYLWKGRDRYIAGGIERGNRVRWSKLLFAGEGVNFPNPTEMSWIMDMDADVTGVAQLDDAWIVGTQNAVYAIYGQGPDDTGQNGGFDTPRRISQNIGVHSGKSFCEIPEGLIFQAEDGQLYLIVRGTLQIIWFSEKVRDLFTDAVTGICAGWVTAAVQHFTRDTIHFCRLGASPVIYDKRVQAWAVDGDNSDAIGSTRSACAVWVASTPALYSTRQSARYPSVALLSDNNKYAFEGCANGDSFGSPSGGSWLATLETSEISLYGLNGWGQVDRVNLLLGTNGASTTGTVSLSWYPNRGATATQTVSVPYSLSSVTALGTSQFEPVVQKLSSFRVRLQWSNEVLAAITVESATKTQSERTVSGVRV